MRLYFASPNKHIYAAAVVGQYVLETFADIRPFSDSYRRAFTGLMLDSGAFTEINSGKKVDLHAYGAFAAEHAADYDVVVNLDDIAGDVDKSASNERVLRDEYGLDPMPVYHQGEPLSVLAEYCARADYVGLGFQRPLLSSDDRRAWLDECFAAVPTGHRLHGFAMTGYMGSHPFYSVDSTTWIRTYMDIAYGAHGQIGTLAHFLTPGEILEIVVKRWERMPRCTSWDGCRKATPQIDLFGVSS